MFGRGRRQGFDDFGDDLVIEVDCAGAFPALPDVLDLDGRAHDAPVAQGNFSCAKFDRLNGKIPLSANLEQKWPYIAESHVASPHNRKAPDYDAGALTSFLADDPGRFFLREPHSAFAAITFSKWPGLACLGSASVFRPVGLPHQHVSCGKSRIARSLDPPLCQQPCGYSRGADDRYRFFAPAQFLQGIALKNVRQMGRARGHLTFSRVCVRQGPSPAGLAAGLPLPAPVARL